MKYTVVLVVGDPSNDGHCTIRNVAFKCNFTKSEVEGFYAATVNLYGFDITAECQEYEICVLSEEFIERAKLAFAYDPQAIKFINFIDQDDEGVDHQEFAKIYMLMAQLSNNEMRFELMNTTLTEIRIGGYGLFAGD